MKVICAGFWKTGTKSLSAALRVLGYKVYDFDDQLFDLTDLWTKFFDGTVTDEEIRKSLENIDVLIDGPVIAFWEEISRVFPEAKVILTMRDEDSWFKSFKNMVDAGWARYAAMIIMFGLYFTPAGRRFFHNAMGVAEFCLSVGGPMQLSFITPPKSPRLCKLKFRKHNCYVRNSVPPEKFLEYNVTDGWGPLCKFLSKEVPDMEYPHRNKKNALFTENEGGLKHPELRRLIIQGLSSVVIMAVLFVYAIYALLSTFF